MVVVVEANQASEHCLIECRHLQYSQINIPGIKFASEGEYLTISYNDPSLASNVHQKFVAASQRSFPA